MDNIVRKWARVTSPDVLKREIVRLETELARAKQKIKHLEKEGAD